MAHPVWNYVSIEKCKEASPFGKRAIYIDGGYEIEQGIEVDINELDDLITALFRMKQEWHGQYADRAIERLEDILKETDNG